MKYMHIPRGIKGELVTTSVVCDTPWVSRHLINSVCTFIHVFYLETSSFFGKRDLFL